MMGDSIPQELPWKAQEMGNRRSAREKRFSNGTWGWTAEGATSFLAGGGIDFYDAINGSPSMTAGRKAGFRKTTIERYVGVDGCKGGWFAVVMGADGGVTMGCHGSVAALWRALKGAKAILIDIPIGLVSESGEGRTADSLARKALAPWRHRSVFSPPCRQTLSAVTYRDACRINQKVCGSKVSIQTWHILPKIKEVDAFLRTTPEARGIVRESHPEICYWALAGFHPMAYSKKKSEGWAERLGVLERYYPRSREVFNDALGRFPRRTVARDDILDALVNAVAAVRLKTAGATLPQEPPSDRCGLSMEMVFAQPSTRQRRNEGRRSASVPDETAL